MMTNIYIINSSVTFSPTQYSMSTSRKTIRLTAKEAEVLALLCHTPNRALCRRTVQDYLWHNQEGADVNLNRTILLLRRKFQSLIGFELIKTIPRVGYIIDESIPVTNLDHNSIETDDITESNNFKQRKSHMLAFISIMVSIVFSILFILKDELEGVLFSNSISITTYPSFTLYSSERNGKLPLPPLTAAHVKPDQNKLFIGKRTISYTSESHLEDGSIDLQQAIYFRRPNSSINSDIQCVINNINNGGYVQFKQRKINNAISIYKMRFYQDCNDTQSWVESINELTSFELDGQQNISMNARFKNEKNKSLLQMELRGYISGSGLFNNDILYVKEVNSKNLSTDPYRESPLLAMINEYRLHQSKYNLLRLKDHTSLSSYLEGILYAL